MWQAANILGQARLYSLLDQLVVAAALTRDPRQVAGIVILHFSFLCYLEGQHKDQLRLAIPVWFWILPYAAAVWLLTDVAWAVGAYTVCSICYTLKKCGRWGLSASLWRGCQATIFALALRPELAGLLVAYMVVRNLVGDIRDERSDREDGTLTVPVFLLSAWWRFRAIDSASRYYRRSAVAYIAYYSHALMVVTTTLVFFGYGWLPDGLLLPIVLLELVSYPLTPRSSTPPHLNLYASQVTEGA